MPSTFANASALTHLNHVKATSQGPLTSVNRTGSDVLVLVRQAMSDVQLKQGAAAAAAHVKESQFSNALNGIGNFGITWLWMQSDAFLLRFFELAMEARGLDAEGARHARAARIGELVRLLFEEAA